MLRASQVFRGGERPGRRDQLAASAHFFSRSRVAWIWAAFMSVRFMTPVSRPADVMNQPRRRSQVLSVTVHPPPEGAISYCHRETGTPVCETLRATAPPGAAAIPTVPVALGCRVVVTPPAGVRSCVDA